MSKARETSHRLSFLTIASQPVFRRQRHLLGLDFLRGVAALCVVCYHLGERIHLPFMVEHGYLAVDFFFALSGYVIASAYEERLSSRSMSVLQFCKMRAVRLLPLVVAGTILAAVIELGRPAVQDPYRHFQDIVIALVYGCLLVPILHVSTLEFTNFPLNGPVWSLLLEIVGNVIFSVWARMRFKIAIVATIALVSLTALLLESLNSNAVRGGSDPDTFWAGFARIGWSMSAGIVAFRYMRQAPRLPLLILFVALTGTFVVPNLGRWNGAFDVLNVIVVLPLIVWGASGVQLPPFWAKVASASGDLSYPIYAIHYPLVRIVGVVGAVSHTNQIGKVALALLGTIIICAASTAAYAGVDVPVRRFLTSRLIKDNIRGRLSHRGSGDSHPEIVR